MTYLILSLLKGLTLCFLVDLSLWQLGYFILAERFEQLVFEPKRSVDS